MGRDDRPTGPAGQVQGDAGGKMWGARTHVACVAIAAVIALAGPVPAAAQAPLPPAPFDTAGLGTGPWSTMSMLYERTILQVDVLRLQLRFGPEAAQAMEWAAGGSTDSIVAEAVDARNAVIRCLFLRDVTLDQFLSGLRKDLGKALESGVIDEAAHSAILADVAVQYQPIAERGFHDGDIMWYRIRGDTLDVVLQTPDGSEPVREQAVGPERRRATLAGFLAPGSHFRQGLLEDFGNGSH